MWNVAPPDVISTSCSEGAQLERHRVDGKRPGDVEEQACGQDGHAVALDLRLEGDAEADLEVGGTELDHAGLDVDLRAGQGLNGGVGGGDPGDRLELSEEGVFRS